MIDKDTVDRIVDSAEIVDVISDFVTLKRRGANYIACCPFHNEKTPSFSVSPSKGIFKCFGCGKAGSAVSFVMEHEQMNYVDALKYLAKKYGIEVVEKEETQEDIAKRLRHESLLIVNEFAQKFFNNILLNDPVNSIVGLSYLKDSRGFTPETINKFGLGFSPDKKSALADAAIKAGYKKEPLITTGLCIERQTGELVDRFYDRIIFPIHSLSGRVIAFGGRTLKADNNIAKYVNSPESEIYYKSRSLYGIFFAKSAIGKADKCYLVEGYTDVISLNQAGIENVVSSSGTSLTTEQIRLIKRFTNRVTVLYDGDPAGIKASLRGIDMLLEEGMEVKVVLFPDGEDPDSFARKNEKSKIQTFLDSAEQDFISFKYDLLSVDISRDPIQRAKLISEIVRTISLIPDQITRTVYMEETASKLNLKQDMLVAEINKARMKRITSAEFQKRREEAIYQPERDKIIAPEDETITHGQNNRSNIISNSFTEPTEKEIIYYLLKYGKNDIYFDEDHIYGADKPEVRLCVADYIDSELKSDDLELQNPIYKKIFHEYFLLPYTEQEKITKHFTNHPDQQISKAVTDIIFSDHILTIKEFQRSLIPEENILSDTVPKAVKIFKAKLTEYAYQLLIEQLGQAQRAGDEGLQKQLMEQIRTMTKLRNHLANELNRLTF